MDYFKYYFLENYLLGEVRNNFKRGYLTPEEFFCIIIFKANRAKTRIKKRLLGKDNNLKNVVRKITSDIFKEEDKNKKLKILLKKWHFQLPMATAILTILYPKDFTIYDIRVRSQLKIKETSSAKKYFSGFFQKVKEFAKKKKLSIRDADRYLFGKSFYEDLKKLLKN